MGGPSSGKTTAKNLFGDLSCRGPVERLVLRGPWTGPERGHEDGVTDPDHEEVLRGLRRPPRGWQELIAEDINFDAPTQKARGRQEFVALTNAACQASGSGR
jgi:hypothetical protein